MGAYSSGITQLPTQNFGEVTVFFIVAISFMFLAAWINDLFR